MKRENLIERAFSLIELLSISGELTIETIAKATQIPKSSVYRILCILEALEYANRTDSESSDKWRLNLRFLRLSANILSRIDIKNEIRDAMMALADDTKEIVQLGVIEQGKAVILDNIKKYRSMVSVAHVGDRIHINSCAAGLVLASYLEDKELDKIIKEFGLPEYTRYSITDIKKFRSELKRIRMQGYAIDNQYFAIGHRCIGAPVFDYSGKAIAAINISGHIQTITEERTKEFAEAVKKRAAEASYLMGYSANGHSANIKARRFLPLAERSDRKSNSNKYKVTSGNHRKQ